ncbi:MAG: IS1634 family transposase [Phycisphaerae bacterium]|nr:IS1634 family transposase [Phycisphaerae bacterium]
MHLRESTQRRADGTRVRHLQLVESVWDREARRSRTEIVLGLGRVDDPESRERLTRIARGILRRTAPEDFAEQSGWTLVDSWPYGDTYVLQALWSRLGLDCVIERAARGRAFGFSVERALFAMVANRCCAPRSKLYCWEQWLRDDVRIPGAEDLQLQHLYRAMDFLEQERESIQREIYFSVSDLLKLDVDLIFYDTTSLHFEVDEEDGEGGLRKRGKSKNKRSDVPQLVVGLAVTRDGLPVRHWVFPGNTVDVSTVQQVKEDLRGWKLGRCVFVGDAGMVSAENLKALSLGGGRYIVAMPMRRGDSVTEEVLGRPGRYKQLAENLRVKEVVVGDGERRRRYAVCHNPHEERRQQAHREELLRALEAELASMRDVDADGHSKRACEIRASERFGRYLRTTRGGRLELNRAKIAEEERYDGKFVVTSNDDTLSAEDMALGYKASARVEEAWRSMKSALGLRPVFHWTEQRIRAHIGITVLALLLERVAERACGDTWRNIRDDLRGIKLAQLSTPDGTVWQVTEPRSDAWIRLKLLGIDKPRPVLKVTG